MKEKNLIDKIKLSYYKDKFDCVVYDYIIVDDLLYIDLYIALIDGRYKFYKSLGIWSEEKMCMLDKEGVISIFDHKKSMQMKLQK